MKNFLIFITILGSIFLMSNCKHHPIEPIGPDPTDTTDNPIDTTLDTTGNGEPCDPNTVYFVQDVLPILSSNCAIPGCHDAGTAQDGVILDSYANVMASGEVDPGDPWSSDVYENLVESDPDKKMPPPGSGITLSQQQINTIYNWILQGAQNNSCDPVGSCDTLNMSFSQDIQPILNTHCKGCHSGTSPQAGINLTAYTSVKTVADNGRLYGAVAHLSGYTPMPYNQAQLSDCKIAKIKNWIDAGAPNN